MAIEITTVGLAADDVTVAKARARLDDEERRRADRFVFPHLRVRFALAHAALRTIVAKALVDQSDGGDLEARAAALRFTTGPWGRPDLATPPPGGLSFNLSHSEDQALVAVARGRTVGVDLERIEPRRALDDVARRVFSPRELAALPAAPPARTQAFFRIWVTKEAYIKAHGKGLHLDLASFDVESDPARPYEVLATRPDPAEATRWWTRRVPAPAGFLAATVCTRREADSAPPPLVCREWDWSTWTATE